MRTILIAGMLMSLLAASGCVSKKTYEEAVEEAALREQSIKTVETRNTELRSEISELRGRISEIEQRLANALADKSALSQDLLRARADLDRLEKLLSSRGEETGRAMTEMRRTIDRLQAENRDLSTELEKQQLAREARLSQMKSTYNELVGKLEAEIERGEITISDLQGKLTVNMVERILFDSGQAEIKPDGLQVLSRVGDILRNVTDKEIRVEGHTDNIPISSRLVDRFPTNWELSTARATNVVHFLQDQTGIPGDRLAACGFGPYRPVADNDTAEGRAENRRIMIVLAPLEKKRAETQPETSAADAPAK